MERDYLKKNGRGILIESEFLDNHLIYRVAKNNNPIDFNFPISTITELSCNWSKLVIPNDILLEKPNLGSFILETSVKGIKIFCVTRHLKVGDSPFNGEHVLACKLYHAPLDEDYSHVQIDILHHFNNEIRRYTRENWKKGYNLLKKKGELKQFFKEIKEEYKFQLALLFLEIPPSRINIARPEFLEFHPNYGVKKGCFLSFMPFKWTSKHSR